MVSITEESCLLLNAPIGSGFHTWLVIVNFEVYKFTGSYVTASLWCQLVKYSEATATAIWEFSTRSSRRRIPFRLYHEIRGHLRSSCLVKMKLGDEWLTISAYLRCLCHSTSYRDFLLIKSWVAHLGFGLRGLAAQVGQSHFTVKVTTVSSFESGRLSLPRRAEHWLVIRLVLWRRGLLWRQQTLAHHALLFKLIALYKVHFE